MSDTLTDSDYGPVVAVRSAPDVADVILVCEHASARIPPGLANLGLSAPLRQSHIAWDPGAAGVAEALARALNAPLVSGQVSRLIYDCNRPPDAASAIPERSEMHAIPGNQNLGEAERNARINAVYRPFRKALSEQIAQRRGALQLMVTVHSFTPVFNGQPRAVELGLLHGSDARFACAMLANAPPTPTRDIRLNEPYSARDGVAHTLEVHGERNGLPSVMLEIRNDLITTPQEQQDWADWLAPWLRSTLAGLSA